MRVSILIKLQVLGLAKKETLAQAFSCAGDNYFFGINLSDLLFWEHQLAQCHSLEFEA